MRPRRTPIAINTTPITATETNAARACASQMQASAATTTPAASARNTGRRSSTKSAMARTATVPSAAPRKTGWMIVPNGRPRTAESVTRSPSSVGTPRKLNPSTPPVRHCSSTTTNWIAVKVTRPASAAQICCRCRTRTARYT